MMATLEISPSAILQPEPVGAFPSDPKPDGHYFFRGLGRSVVEHNHGLHKYPAKFVPQIPRWALDYGGGPECQTVLDPFGGSGTTALEAALAGHRAISIDINPLARVIASAKLAVVSDDFDDQRALATILVNARQRTQRIEEKLVPGMASYGMHHTWSNWFEPQQLAELIAIREAIEGEHLPQRLDDLLLSSLSSVAKSCSRLDENQIKVRSVPNKVFADPFDAFAKAVGGAIEAQRALTPTLLESHPADVLVGSARELPLANDSVDRIITSPPYINAVDYTMAHKYNLFILGLLTPNGFKDHCREYVGMTERAVRASDLTSAPRIGHSSVDAFVDALWSRESPVARNRAFIVAQFFTGMQAAFREMSRVLRSGGRAITVIGSNRICGLHIPTDAICERLAIDAGLTLELRFYHHIANVSSMRLNRNATGGKIPYETIHAYSRA